MSHEPPGPHEHAPHEPHESAGEPYRRAAEGTHSSEGARVPSPRGEAHETDERTPRHRARKQRPSGQTTGSGTDERGLPGKRLPATAAVLVIALACLVGLVSNTLNMGGTVLAFFPQALLALLLCAITLVVGFWLLRRIRPVRAPSLTSSVTAVAWGALAATGVAAYANTGLGGLWGQVLGFETAGAWSAALSAPLNEELLKVAGVVIIAVAFPRAVRGPVDGFVIGALVGLGFMVLENMLYALNSIASTGGLAPSLAVTQTIGVRVFLTGLGSHWALTGIAGTAVGLVAVVGWRPRARRVVGALLLVLLAVVLHGVLDAPPWAATGGTLINVALVFVCAMAVYFTARHVHRHRVKSVLAEEGEALMMHRSAAIALATRHGRRQELHHVAAPEHAAVRRRQTQMVNTAEDRAAPRPS